MARAIIKVLDKTLDTAILIVCVLLLLIGAYSVLDNLWLYENATDRSALLYKPPVDEPLAEEKRISENQVAWVAIDDTTIDYPIMQGKDNYEFLNKNPYGEFALSGSIFLDSRNDEAFTDPYSLIYGHHMAHGAMFGALDDFLDRAYFDAHRTGRVVTKTAVYDFTAFAVSYADGTDQTIFDPTDRMTSEIYAFLEENARIYLQEERGDRIVALSTCSGDASTTRLIVFGTIRERATKEEIAE